MRNIWLLLGGLLLSTVVLAGRDELQVNSIADSMLLNASSVVRNADVELHVYNAGKVSYTYHKQVTILNERGAGEQNVVIYYDKFRTVTSFKAVVYDKNGKLLSRRAIEDLEDYSASDGFSLYRDARIKRIQLGGGMYPYTINYEYTVLLEGVLDYPEWRIQDEGQAVEKSVFKVSVPLSIPLYYKSYNIALQPDSVLEGSEMSFVWSVSGLKPLQLPANSYTHDYFLPYVDVTPLYFELAGKNGSWDGWQAFGKSMADMWQHTRDLSPEARAEIKQLVKPTDTEQEKIARLYNFLQHNFRYVSVQIGLGGYVPFSANSVHAARYGDCKGLSNYMCAMLAAVGVKSYPALINAGKRSHAIDTAFPTNDFNHAILCAYTANGPLWLECTSNTMPCGQLGSFTENRYALLLTDTGGVLVKTPVAKPNQNVVSVNSYVIADTGYRTTSKISLTGEYRYDASHYFMMGNDKERADYVLNTLGLKVCETYNYADITDSMDYVQFIVNSNGARLNEFKNGGKTFLPSTLMKQWYSIIPADSTTKADILLGHCYSQQEELTYQLKNSQASSLPVAITLDNELIAFTRTVQSNPDNTITIKTQLAVKKTVLDAAGVAAYKLYMQQVNKYLQQKVITG